MVRTRLQDVIFRTQVNNLYIFQLPEEEQDGPLELHEAGDDSEGDDPGEDGEEQEWVAHHDEEQRVGRALVVERRRPHDVHEGDHRSQSVDSN